MVEAKEVSKEVKPAEETPAESNKPNWTIVDENMSYVIKKEDLILKIHIGKDLEINEDNISSTNKTYRIYSNSTNRRFIKKFPELQGQINFYVSKKDAEKLGLI